MSDPFTKPLQGNDQILRYTQAKRVTFVGALINIILGCLKLLGGLIYNSNALIADGIHSFSDLLTDLTVVFASKFGNLSPDESHPYGHKRIETAATLLLALFLILAGLGIILDAIKEWTQVASKPGLPALLIAFLSMVANEILFHYTFKIGKGIQSSLVIANAWHHRSDAASSLVVTLGLLGSILGYPYLDGVAAVIVGLMIIKMGISYGWGSVRELVDTAVAQPMSDQIQHIIAQIDGVNKIHQLRTRSMGGDIFIDVHILVDPFISVSEGHYIAQNVHHQLLEAIPEVTDVTVHVDPEDDEICAPSLHLPSRTLLKEELILPLLQKFRDLSWRFHYLDGKIHLDLFSRHLAESEELVTYIEDTLKSNALLQSIRLFYQVYPKNN